MKAKLLSIALAAAASFGSANAVTLNMTGIANTSVGLITEGLSDVLVTGNATFYSTSVNLSAADLTGIEASANPLAFFEALVNSDPGLVRGPVAFTDGAMLSPGSTELGAVGNQTYLFLSSTDGSWYGIYQGQAVPGVGAVTFNPATITEDLVGTSTLTAVNGTNSGFQLVTAVPEPSIALLGALGVFGLIRRRR